MTQADDKYIKLLDQDSYLIDPRNEQRVPLLEADYDMVLNYFRMFWSEPPVVRVLYQRIVEEDGLVPSENVEQMLQSASEAAMKLAKLSVKFPSPEAYASNWLARKPLMRVLVARVAQETPADDLA